MNHLPLEIGDDVYVEVDGQERKCRVVDITDIGGSPRKKAVYVIRLDVGADYYVGHGLPRVDPARCYKLNRR